MQALSIGARGPAPQPVCLLPQHRHVLVLPWLCIIPPECLQFERQKSRLRPVPCSRIAHGMQIPIGKDEQSKVVGCLNPGCSTPSVLLPGRGRADPGAFLRQWLVASASAAIQKINRTTRKARASEHLPTCHCHFQLFTTFSKSSYSLPISQNCPFHLREPPKSFVERLLQVKIVSLTATSEPTHAELE